MSSTGSFGRLIRARRRALDLTQEELARQVGYSVITIRKVEADERRPSRQLAELLARNLQITPEEQPAFTRLARSAPETGDWPLPTGAATVEPSPPSTLPQPLTRLIGREGEVDAVRAAVLNADNRIVTLVGPPGIGKTRLSVQVATELRTAFPSGTFYVPLGLINDAALVPLTIAKAVGLKELGGQPLFVALTNLLRPWQVLLLMDNLEHLLDAAPAVAELLTACPGLKVLATSRAPLRIRGERLYPVPPLAAPQPSTGLQAADVHAYAAVQLFTERAHAGNPDFCLTDANAADIARICTDLDGLPLAIELVAARSRLMSPRDLVARLGDRLALLTGGPRDLPEHQQTLRSTLDWSFNLLDPKEQLLFARLAVFIGGCTLRGAEHVGNAPGEPPLTILDGLFALADKNLLGQEERADGERYFTFLRTVREYALERLVERGEEDSVRARYAEYHLNLAETANANLGGEDQQLWLDRLDASQDNLRAVLEWYVLLGAAEPGLRLIAALWSFWHIRFRQAEGLRWVTRVLALPAPADEHIRAMALIGAGWVALDQGANELAGGYFAEGLDICRRLGDQPGLAMALHGVGIITQVGGDDAAAERLFAESLDIYRSLQHEEGIAWSLDHLGNAALGLGDHRLARERFAESLGIFRGLGQPWGMALSLHHDGLAAHALGEHGQARERFVESMRLYTELANGWGVAISHANLGNVALSTEDIEPAAAHFAQSLRTSYAEHYRDGVARALAGLASVAVRRGDPVRAASLFGGAQALAEASGIRMDPAALAIHRRDTDIVRSQLAEERVAHAWQAGRTMSMAELVALAATGESDSPQ
jgi:predicted ATPase/transcriptional regulator with XRE-family HTH domain